MCQLLEPKISVRCRQQDQSIVQSVIASAVDSVKDKIKMETDVTLDTETFLPADRYFLSDWYSMSIFLNL